MRRIVDLLTRKGKGLWARAHLSDACHQVFSLLSCPAPGLVLIRAKTQTRYSQHYLSMAIDREWLPVNRLDLEVSMRCKQLIRFVSL